MVSIFDKGMTEHDLGLQSHVYKLPREANPHSTLPALSVSFLTASSHTQSCTGERVPRELQGDKAFTC